MSELSKSILILDDDPLFRGMVTDLLKLRGITVIEARSGKEADMKLGGANPALAIVDYRLPESDGVSWITRMRESNRNFPIIFCSGTWCDEKTFSWLRNILRVSLILRKPIDTSLFIQQIESLLPAHVLLDAERSLMEMAPPVVETMEAWEAHAVKSNDQSLLVDVKSVRAKMARTQQFAQVRVQYAQELESSWQNLTHWLEQARADSANTLALSEAIQQAHKIRGTAGSLGYDRIGICAGKIEDLLRAIDPEDTMLGVIWSEIERAVETGDQSLQQHLALANKSDSVTDEVVYSKLLLLGSEKEYAPLTKNVQTKQPVEFVIADSSASVSVRVKQTVLDGAIIDFGTEASLPRVCNLVSEVRSQPGQQGLPVAFIAAITNPPDEAQVLYAGGSVCLHHKPDKTDIQQLANTLLDLRQKDKPKILSVDDDEMLTGFIASVLSAKHMAVRTLNKPILIMEAMKEFQPDLILLDVIMPGLSGYDVCRMLRSTEEYADIPIVFLTSRNDAEGRASAFQAGGNDFLSKPVLSDELIARVRAQLNQRQSGLKDAQGEAILNGMEFFQTCQEIVQVPDGALLPLSIALLGLDDFVNLSVVHGFLSAQDVVKKLTILLNLRFRNEDVRGRLSDDGFALAFPGVNKTVASAALQHFLGEFSELRFASSGMGNFKVTFSAGVADSTEFENAQGILGEANRRFIESKKARFGAITAG